MEKIQLIGMEHSEFFFFTLAFILQDFSLCVYLTSESLMDSLVSSVQTHSSSQCQRGRLFMIT